MAFPWTVFLTLFVTVILASSQCQGCNQTLSRSSGSFTSPGFPQDYEDNIYCTWRIVNPNNVILLGFNEFELEGGTCSFDYVAVYDGSVSTDRLLGKYCGSTLPSTTRSTGNTVYVIFKTDGSISKKGFSAAYQSQVCIKGRYGPNCVQECNQSCLNNDCDGVTGTCTGGCKVGYTGHICDVCVKGRHGPNCEQECNQGCVNNDCDTVTGTCTSGCQVGYTGDSCDVCITGKHGRNCSQECNQGCLNNVCDGVTGTCTGGCKVGYTGDSCDDCMNERYGPDCNLSCPVNCVTGCQRNTGYCNECVTGYYGNFCEIICSSGQYGPSCSLTCPVNCRTRDCHHVNGTCADGCKDGYSGTKCTSTCPKGMYGPDCGLTCSPNCEGGECNHVNGHCTGGCTGVYVGDMCDTVCDSGTYGTGCQNNCSQNCKDGDCHPRTGHCDGCIDGYTGDICEYACQAGKYGPSCNKTCSINCFINATDFVACHHETGACPQGCVEGYTGQRCDSEDSSDTLVMGIGIGAGAMVLVVIAIVVGVCCYRRRSSRAPRRQEPHQDYDETKMGGQEEHSYKGMYQSDDTNTLPTDSDTSEAVYQNDTSEAVYQNVNSGNNRNTTLSTASNPYEEVTEMKSMDGREGDAGTSDVFRTTAMSTERNVSGVYVNVGMTE